MRAVRLLDKIDNPDEPQGRDEWWHDVREEIQSHARSIGCNSVVGYIETTSINDNVCLLIAQGNRLVALHAYCSYSGTGTAACVAMESAPGSNANLARSESSSTLGSYQGALPGQIEPDVSARRLSDHVFESPCSVFHTISSNIPPAPDAESFPCQACHEHDATVPDYLITTSWRTHFTDLSDSVSADLPPNSITLAPGSLIQARVCRMKKRSHRGEDGAAEIADVIPFLEYDIHRQIISKLRLKGYNALLYFRMQVRQA